MKNKILKFDLDSKDIKLKKLLEGDFLRLEAYTISDAKPNRNNSCFTLESMKKAIPTFYDKPVLAYYNPNLGKDGDFMGHECPNGLQYDESVGSLYYDYTSPKSEVPIGTVRQSDSVEIVSKDGLNWIKVTCVLWTKYNYKAVRSLLRSRNGKTKLSVEIEVLKGHDEDGIEIIDEFQLDGFTLLGRNEKGQEIEEGIAGAHATALDFLDEKFAEHQKCLAFAYSALDDYTNKQKVETPKEVRTSRQDSNINFEASDVNSDADFEENDSDIENEEQPQLAMEEEKGNQREEGGKPAMQLTMHAKMELLQIALEKAIHSLKEAERDEEGRDEAESEHEHHENEIECCCCWVMDLDENYVFYECMGEKFRCPYSISELDEEHEVTVDLNARERVIPSWSLFIAEDNSEIKNEFEHGEEGEQGGGHEGHKCIECTIRDLIIDEEEAIQGYSHAEKRFAEEVPEIAKVFHEIKEEEEVHIGELQECLQMVNDETHEHIAEGIQEAKEIIVNEGAEEHPHEGHPEEGHPEEGHDGNPHEEHPHDDNYEQTCESSNEDGQTCEEKCAATEQPAEDSNEEEKTCEEKACEEKVCADDKTTCAEDKATCAEEGKANKPVGPEEEPDNTEDTGDIGNGPDRGTPTDPPTDKPIDGEVDNPATAKDPDESSDAPDTDSDTSAAGKTEKTDDSEKTNEAKDEEEPEEDEEPEDSEDDEDSDNDDSKDSDDTEKTEQPEKSEECAQFAEQVRPDSEPNTVDVAGMTMPEIIAAATELIVAPEVETEPAHLGDATAALKKLDPRVEPHIVGDNKENKPVDSEGEMDKPDTPVEQPDDRAKENMFFEANQEHQTESAKQTNFASTVELNGEKIDINALLEKYNELEGKLNAINESVKNQEVAKLSKFGADFINADEVVDEETKQTYISQVEEKCKAFELKTEEEVTKFAKGLMAMYYYEHPFNRKETKNADFSISINRPTHIDNNASHNKLKDAINKLNYLNKEE